MLKNVIMVLCASALVLSSCKKTEDSKLTASEAFTNLDQQLIEPNQAFAVDVSYGAMIIGKKGTRIVLYQGQLRDANGNPVTGTVQVELKELYKVGEMIGSNKLPLTSNGLLASSGEVFVSITQNGTPLRLAYPMRIQFPNGELGETMNLFYGQGQSDGGVLWNLASNAGTSTANLDCSQDSIERIYNPSNIPLCDTLNTFYSDSLNWINCDRYYSVNPNTNIKINVLNAAGLAVDEANTRVRIAIPQDFAVAGAHYNTGGYFDLGSGYFLPVGYNAVIVVLHYDATSAQWYSAFQPITITNNHVENVTLQATTIAQYQQALAGL